MMIALHIRFNNGDESFRTVSRVEINKDKGLFVVFDTPASSPEVIQSATIRVYIPGTSVGHTYIV